MKEPEDVFYFPDEDGPESLDDVIEIASDQFRRMKYRAAIAECHRKILFLAREKNISPVDGIFPAIDDIISEDGFLIGTELSKAFSLTVNIRDDDSTIKLQLDKFKEQVLSEVAKLRNHATKHLGGYAPQFLTAVARDPKGTEKDIESLVRQIDEAILVYRKRNIQGEHPLAIAIEMKFIDDTRDEKRCSTAEKKIERLCNYATRLIQAAMNGTFTKEVSKPLRGSKLVES